MIKCTEKFQLEQLKKICSMSRTAPKWAWWSIFWVLISCIMIVYMILSLSEDLLGVALVVILTQHI